MLEYVVCLVTALRGETMKITMFDKKELDDGFSEAKFYTVSNPDVIFITDDGKAFKNNYSGVLAFYEHIRNMMTNLPSNAPYFTIKLGDEYHKACAISIQPAYLEPSIKNNTLDVLVEIEAVLLYLDNSYVKISNYLARYTRFEESEGVLNEITQVGEL